MAVNLRICGTGALRPARTRDGAEMDGLLGKPPGWSARRLKIESRGVAAPNETSTAMAATAAEEALAAAGWTAGDLDVLISACGVMEQPIPGAAALVQKRLGLGASGIPAFDVNVTCLSFLLGLDVAGLGFAAGRWRRALIVSADIASAALDFARPEASAIFGDGAAAAAIEATSEANGSALLACRLETYGDGAELSQLQAGGTRLRPHEDIDGFLAGARFQMDGPNLFRATTRRFPGFVQRVLEQAETSLDDIALVIPHQASASALDYLRHLMPGKPVIDIFSDHGNQIAASLPSALHAAITQGRVKRGDHLLLLGAAAGISLGGAVLKY
ncbi:MAG: hypothetical protein JWM33_1237 [Caulobacteraceae bacterium]|nr:hypothetical protein [Caulobacteraceae bacterium]